MSREIKIDDEIIGDNQACYIIAEIGHNHQGDLEKAKQLFAAAKASGVQAVKLQKRDNRRLYTRELFERPYDHENSFGDTYGAHREALEFGRAEYVELQAYARALGITLFATAFDFGSADFLAELDMPAYKIASGDLNNLPLLKHVAAFGKPMIVSTGGANMLEVQRAYDTILALNPQLVLLQCTASYPAEPEHMNLRVISTYQNCFPEAVVGLSDHQNGIAMAVISYVLGGRVVEKHFTLNHAAKGTDHAFSLEPTGMRKLVRDLQRARVALGDGVKRTYPEEVNPLYKMGKKLVAARDLPLGHVLTRDDVDIKSPNDGLPPYELDNVLGKALRRPLSADDNLQLEDLSETA